MRVKGYDSLKIPAIPKNAAEARGFRNTVYSAITKLAKGDESKILTWISLTQTSQDMSDFDHSGNYPLLDRLLGHKLLELARGTKFSLDFQAVQEASQKIGKQPKGRLLLWFVFQKYKMEKDRGTALTQHHLLSLTMHGHDTKSLEDFRQRFNYIFEALEVAERPTEASLRSLLFEQLKCHPKMTLHIDRFRNASSGSSKRCWRWLYDKMCEVIEIAQPEENAEAIDKALKPKSSHASPAPKSNPAKGGDKAEKDKERKEKEEKDRKDKEKKDKKKEKERAKKEKKKEEERRKEEAAPSSAPNAPAKGKGKGRDKSPKKEQLTEEQKAKFPCMFFAYDACTAGDSCSFLHDRNNLYKGPKPRKLKSTSAGAASVMAGAAIASVIPTSEAAPSGNGTGCGLAALQSPKEVSLGKGRAARKRLGRVSRSLQKSVAFRGGVLQRAFITIMTAMACLDPMSSINAVPTLLGLGNETSADVEFLVDSGAGRNLVSKRVLPDCMHAHFGEAPEKLTFETGGGPRSGTKAVRLQSESLGNNVFYELPKCPPAVSLGIQVNEHKKPFVWMPDELPYFVKPERAGDFTIHCPESAKIRVDRVEENVPIMKQRITCSGLPAPVPSSSSKEPPPPEPPEHLRRRHFVKSRPSAADPKDPEGPKEPPAPMGLRLKPDPKLPKFGKDDELSHCVEPVPAESDAPLDSDDDQLGLLI